MSNKDIRVYIATKENAEKLKELRCMLVTENPLAYGNTPEEECLKPVEVFSNWIEEYSSSNGAFFLLDLNNETIGMGAIKRDDNAVPTTAYMGSFGVLKTHQHNGYGRLLLEYGLNYAREHGFKSIKTITTKTNEQALGMLKIYGFKITGEGVYKGIPEYFLELVL